MLSSNYLYSRFFWRKHSQSIFSPSLLFSTIWSKSKFSLPFCWTKFSKSKVSSFYVSRKSILSPKSFFSFTFGQKFHSANSLISYSFSPFILHSNPLSSLFFGRHVLSPIFLFFTLFHKKIQVQLLFPSPILLDKTF